MTKNNNGKLIFIWVAAIIITLSAAVFQRKTGPTYPKVMYVQIDSVKHKIELLRSSGGEQNAEIKLRINDKNAYGKLFYKNYPETDTEGWMSNDFVVKNDEEGSFLTAELPLQPPAGKLLYYVELSAKEKLVFSNQKSPVIIRFKGHVPASILIPHIIFMFFAMLTANLAGLFAAFNFKSYKLLTVITLVLIFIGGLILGPLVQKYAFNEYWAGVPNGWDLTDNKLLFAFIFWLAAFVGNLKSEKTYLTILAAILTIIIFSIPHSMFGSELNRESGKIIQGFVSFFSFFR